MRIQFIMVVTNRRIVILKVFREIARSAESPPPPPPSPPPPQKNRKRDEQDNSYRRQALLEDKLHGVLAAFSQIAQARAAGLAPVGLPRAQALHRCGIRRLPHVLHREAGPQLVDARLRDLAWRRAVVIIVVFFPGFACGAEEERFQKRWST